RNQRIRLRVGSAHFETTMGSLTTVPSRLPELLEQLNNNDEEMVLDGNQEAFRVILNFLRDGEIDLPDERDDRSEEWIHSIIEEAERLELTSLIDFIHEKREAPTGNETEVELRRGDKVTWRNINL
ncbi:hypothetical protein PFISCL1PPCAC_8680, partial [Pristionchus fissidentatus]